MSLPISANPKGTNLSRYIRALVMAKGKKTEAIEISKRWADSPAVRLTLEKAAVAAGGLAAGNWASTLGTYGIAAEFVDVLRGVSIIGKLAPQFRTVPFRVKVPRETAAATAAWVGEQGFKGLSPLTYDLLDGLEQFKAVIVTVFTDELGDFSNPAIEPQLRVSLAASEAAFIDDQFLNPAVAAVAGTNPASITNGLVAIVSTGGSAAQILADLNSMIAALASFASPVFVMRPSTAVHIAAASGSQFPDIRYNGGTLCGVPVVTSTNSPQQICLFDAAEILFAQSEVMIDSTREANILMDDGGSPARADIVSMWQSNMVGIRIEQYLSWARAHDNTVVYMTVAY